MPFAETWRNVKVTMLSEESQTEKERYHMISLLHGIKKKRIDTNEVIYKIVLQA